MRRNWTAEPWKQTKEDGIVGPKGEIVQIGHSNIPGDIRRAIKCVNACRGLRTPEKFRDTAQLLAHLITFGHAGSTPETLLRQVKQNAAFLVHYLRGGK
mgnify:CR=1 FL=1